MACLNCGRDRHFAVCRCIPGEFWQYEDVTQALKNRDVTRIVRLLRVRTDLSQETIARLTGLSQAMVSQMEAGQRSLRDPAKKRRALDGLGAPEHAGPPATTASLLDAAGIDPDERDRLRYSLQHPSRIDGPAVTAFATVLSTQRRLDDTLGATALTPVTMAHLGTARDLARNVRGRHDHALHTVAAEYVQFAGWLHASTGCYRDAVPLLLQAEELADAIGDGTLAAQALNFRGYVARQQQNPAGVVRYFLAAYHAPGAHPAQRLGDAAQTAQGYAILGERDQALRLLDQATALTDQAASRTPPGTAYWLTPTFHMLNLGIATLALNEHTAAADLISTGLDGLPDEQQNADWTREYKDALHTARTGPAG